MSQGSHLSRLSDRLFFDLKKSKFGPEAGQETSQPLHPRNRTLVGGGGEIFLSAVVNELPDPSSKVPDIRGIPVKKIEDLFVFPRRENNVVRYTVPGVGCIQCPDCSVEPSEVIRVKSLFVGFLDGPGCLKDHFLEMCDVPEGVGIRKGMNAPKGANGFDEEWVFNNSSGNGREVTLAPGGTSKSHRNRDMVSNPQKLFPVELRGEVINDLITISREGVWE